MAKGVNRVILIGNLGQDPDTRYMPNGNAVTNISVATSEQWKDQQGEKQERTEWSRVTFFGKLAEIAGHYLHKGSKVYVSGRLQTDKWTDQQGVDRYMTKIIANEMQMLDGVSKNGVPQEGGQQQAPPQSQGAPQQQASGAGGDFSDFDDDIPF